jgi:hypothetical protein
MLDIQADLQADIRGVIVDGAVSRHWDAGVAIVNALRSSGRLPSVLIVDLGTNGSVGAEQFDAMMQAASGVNRVVFATVRVPRPWEEGDNATIRAGVSRYPNTVLADWYGISAGHPEWFAPDGYHVEGAGAQALAALIASVI